MGVLGDGDLGAAGVGGLGEGLDEALGGAGDELEVTGEVGVECGVEEADLRGGREFEGADCTGVGDDGEEALLG